MKRLLLLMVAAMLAVFVCAPMVLAQEESSNPDDYPVAQAPNGQKFVPGEVVVFKKNGDVKVKKVKADKLEKIKEKAAEIKAADLEAETVTPNGVSSLDASVNDPRWDQQWNLRQTRFNAAWNHRNGAPRICVVDSGWDRSHPDLRNTVVAERDFVGSDAPDGIAEASTGHGTHVAGIAGAENDNGKYIAGASWNARLVIAKAANSRGNLADADIAQALNWCNNVPGVSVVNASFGGPDPNQGIENKVADLISSGKTVVAAVGNGGPDQGLSYPAAYPEVIGVAATTQTAQAAWFSNSGSNVDLAAPGVDILSTWVNDSVAFLDGTSMAAPHVSALAAMLYADGLDRVQTRNRMYARAIDVYQPGWDPMTGHGIIDAGCSVRAIYC